MEQQQFELFPGAKFFLQRSQFGIIMSVAFSFGHVRKVTVTCSKMAWLDECWEL